MADTKRSGHNERASALGDPERMDFIRCILSNISKIPTGSDPPRSKKLAKMVTLAHEYRAVRVKPDAKRAKHPK
jgi:hypothetical protein